MIDCGSGVDNWPSKLLKYYSVTKNEKPAPIPNHPTGYALDKLLITHPHGDHIGDIAAIHDEIGFYLFVGGYGSFIDNIEVEQMDFRKRNLDAARKFKEVVKKYIGKYDVNEDRVAMAKPTCCVKTVRYINFTKDMDFNDLSWFVSFEIGSHKVLFTGDMTSSGITEILSSSYADDFMRFVEGTTVLKIPHHGRVDGSSQEMFDAFGIEPILCIASDEVLNEKNEGTSNIKWYSDRTSDIMVNIDGSMQNRKVLTTRKDKDIYLQISDTTIMSVQTNCFKDIKPQILGS